jgi:hypothetical protein
MNIDENQDLVARVENKRAAFFLIIILLALCVVVGLALRLSVIHNQGIIKTININVYQDANCTLPLSVINWGTVEPSETRNVTAYLRNEGNTPILAFISTNNYDPLNASLFLQVYWNYDGSSIEPFQVFQAAIFLHVASNVTGINGFSFDIIIEGKG